MKKTIIALLAISLLLLAACQTTQPAAEPQPTAPQTTPAPEPAPAPEPPEKEITETQEKIETLGMDLEKACELLLPIQKFAEICGLNEADIVSTQKTSQKTCWITFTDKNNKALTAGLTVVDWLSADEAKKEFDRGLSQRRLQEEQKVGDRNYNYPQVDRENIVWAKDKYLTTIGASTKLCTKEQLLKLAQHADKRLG